MQQPTFRPSFSTTENSEPTYKPTHVPTHTPTHTRNAEQSSGNKSSGPSASGIILTALGVIGVMVFIFVGFNVAKRNGLTLKFFDKPLDRGTPFNRLEDDNINNAGVNNPAFNSPTQASGNYVPPAAHISQIDAISDDEEIETMSNYFTKKKIPSASPSPSAWGL